MATPRIRYRKGPALERLREMNKAFTMTEAEKAGPVLAVLATPHVAQVKRAFSSEGATTGQGAWAPLSPKYAAWKRKKVGALGMLIFSGQFKAAATTLGLIIREYTAPNVYGLGFENEKGARHERGTDHIPLRTVLQKTPQDLHEMSVAYMRFWIDRAKAIIRNGGRPATRS